MELRHILGALLNMIPEAISTHELTNPYRRAGSRHRMVLWLRGIRRSLGSGAGWLIGIGPLVDPCAVRSLGAYKRRTAS